MPFASEYEGQVSFVLPCTSKLTSTTVLMVTSREVRTVGFAGQQTLDPSFATLPKALASLLPAQSSEQLTD